MAVTEKVAMTIPKYLMDTVRELSPPRGYSKFIAEAIKTYIEAQRRYAIRERLIVGYQANAAADAEYADEWQPVEDETWLTYVPAYYGQEAQ